MGGATLTVPGFPLLPPTTCPLSGVLVKAVLLGGATAMAGNVQLIDPSSKQWQNLPLGEPPSFRQGWGRLDLARALPLLSSPLGWNLQARGEEGVRGTGGWGTGGWDLARALPLLTSPLGWNMQARGAAGGQRGGQASQR